MPVLDIGATSLTDARQIVEHYETLAPPALALYPADPAPREEAKTLFAELYDGLGIAVRAWAYAYQLPQRTVTTRAWLYRAPRHERILVPPLYPLIAKRLGRGLGLHAGSIPEQRALIDASLARLGERLSDGRRYLLGDRLTAPDLALAALTTPAIVPTGYRGALPGFDTLPPAMQREVTEFRAHPVGQFAERLYREERRRPAA